MNHNIKFAAIGISVLALFSNISVSASTLTNFDVETQSLTSYDFQAGTSGSLSSTSTNTSLTSYTGSGAATATATASDTGVTTASVSGLIQPGFYGESPTEYLDLSAKSYYSIALTNDFAYSIDFTYDFLIDPSYIELASNAIGSGAQAKSSVTMNLNGDYTTETVNLQWYNTGYGEVFSTTGDATRTDDLEAGSFRYDLAAVAGTFSGTLAIGEVVTISTMIDAYVYGNTDFGTIETDFMSQYVGGKAFAGDPNGLSISGFGITPTVSAVPLPASAWFFATGLLGLFGMAKRKKA